MYILPLNGRIYSESFQHLFAVTTMMIKWTGSGILVFSP